jgi:hypothetical protein
MTRSLSQVFALLAFGCSLVSTSVAQRKMLDHLPQDAEAITQALPSAVDVFEAIELPGEGRVRAVACGKSDLWLVRDEIVVMTVGDVLVNSPGERKVRRRLPAPEGLLGLTADDRFFYVLLQHAIVVLDATTDREVQRIELPDNSKQDPVAIGAHGDELFISWPDRLLALHKRTTKRRACNPPSLPPRWLAGDGRSLWRGDRLGFGRVDTSSQGRRLLSRVLPPLYDGGLATFVGERLLLVKNLDIAGKRVAAAFLDPETAQSTERLRIGLHAGAVGLSYEVGPKPLANAKSVTMELQRIAQDPSAMVPGPNDKTVLIPVMLVVYPGVTVEELAAAWDLVTAAGFAEVHCISHNSELRTVEPPPPPPGRIKRR